MAVTWCDLCDNVRPQRKVNGKRRKCKGKGIIKVGKNGVWRGN